MYIYIYIYIYTCVYIYIYISIACTIRCLALGKVVIAPHRPEYSTSARYHAYATRIYTPPPINVYSVYLK